MHGPFTYLFFSWHPSTLWQGRTWPKKKNYKKHIDRDFFCCYVFLARKPYIIPFKNDKLSMETCLMKPLDVFGVIYYSPTWKVLNISYTNSAIHPVKFKKRPIALLLKCPSYFLFFIFQLLQFSKKTKIFKYLLLHN